MSRLKALVLVVSLSSIVLAIFSLDQITDSLLERDAFSEGIHWAKNVEASLDNLDQLFAGHPERSNAPEVLQQLSLIGRIYRYEFIDPQGKIVFDTSSYQNTGTEKSRAPAKLVKPHSSSVPEERKGFQNNNHSNHNQDEALTNAKEFSHVSLKKGDGKIRPKYYAHVNHQISKNGHHLGTLRLHIDQTETRALLNDIMYGILFVLSCMSVFAFGLPAFLYLRGKTKEKNIQREFLQHQKRFEAALSSMHQGFCMYDAEGKIIIANERFATIYGLTPEHIKPGIGLQQLVEIRIKNGCYIGKSPDDHRNIIKNMRSNLTGVSRTYQLNDGRYVSVCDQPMADGGWLTTHEDITTRKQSELKLNLQNDQFDAAISNISQGLCMFDGDKNLIVSNDSYATIFGLEPEVIKPGMNLSEIIKLRIETGSFVGETPKSFKARADEWITGLHEKNGIHQLTDGRYIEILLQPMAGGGWLSTQEDVTERTQAKFALAMQNHQFDMAISNISQGLCLFDKEKKLIVSNDLYATIFDLTPDMITPGMHILEIINLRIEKGTFVKGDSEGFREWVEEWHTKFSDFTETFQLTDGRYVELLFRPMDGGGWLSTQEDVTDRITAKNELMHRNERLDAALETMTQGLCMFDVHKNVVVSNDQYAEIYKLPPELIKPGTSLQKIIDCRIEKGTYSGLNPEEYREERLEWAQSREDMVKISRLHDGRYIEIRNHPMAGGGWLSTHDNVTERVEVEATLSEQNRRFDAALTAMPHGLSMFDEHENIIISNEQYATIYGLKAEQIKPGMSLTEIVEMRINGGCYIGDADEEIRNKVKRLRNNRNGRPRTYILNDHRYVEIRDHIMADGGWLSIHEDVTDRHESEKKIKYLADYDTLTSLPNRTQIHDTLKSTIQEALKNGTEMALLYIDLDGFKEVNDTLGHPVGDRVLYEIGMRLMEFLGDSIVAGRLSGDEFVMIVKEFNYRPFLERLGEQICLALEAPIHVEHDVIVISASIGIAVGPPANGEADTLIQFSDLALYKAKADGGNRYCFFEDKMYAKAKERQRMAADLRSAIRNNELLLHYQPQIDLRTNEINGYEALVRWQHRELGMISPFQFIGLAEETGQISEIGEWVLRTACEYAVSWPNKEKISVNLSPIQFKRQDVVTMVKRVLWETGLDPQRLELEITESVLIQSTDSVIIVLRTLAEMGVSIALDDFGTGFSSLSYLTTFPFNKIKIDKSFIDDLGKDSEVTAIVAMIIGLGRSLDTIITAEGIEDIRQHELLRASGCDQAQGYLYGKPLPQILDSGSLKALERA